MTKAFNKLKTKLEELFQLDQADLDFGIYRIMNARRDDITRFLSKDLLPQVRDAFDEYKSSDKAEIQKELAKVIEGAKAAGVDPEQAPKVKELRAKLDEDSVDITAMANDVYDHLHRFFSRYYDEGDFISLRRYKQGVYAIPYEGEEVKLHWANADQYYIKTSENFKDYAFKVAGDSTVHFKIVEADTEKDNIKATHGKERRFVLCDESPVGIESDELIIRFEYRPDEQGQKQDALNKQAAETVMAALETNELLGWHKKLSAIWTRANGEKSEKTLLEKHLNDYTKRNTFDYFIHKDLSGFLRRELDFYIKNEVMRLDDIEEETAARVEQYLSKIKVIRRIAHKIIEFLAQIENFQKKLWLKKKFVVETNYCITLDRVPEDLYEEIAANEAQHDEWVKLFAIDEIGTTKNTKKEGKNKLFNMEAGVAYSKPLTIEFLKANDKLVLDTKFFGEEFKGKLIASIEDFNHQCSGILIRSDNFHGLSLMQQRYRKSIKSIYIDPPYNTDSAPILYKNDYRHSSWATLIRDRVALAKDLLTDDGTKTVAIDDTELLNLSKILEDEYKNYRLSRITVIHNPKGSITKDFNRVHEYAIFLTPENAKRCIARTLVENSKPRKMRRWGENSLRTERRLSFYPIYIQDKKIVRVGEVPEEDFHPENRNVQKDNGEIEIWPIDQDGVERRWNFGLDSINDNLDRVVIIEIDSTYDLFVSHEKTVSKTVWSGGDYDAGNYGNTLLINIIGCKKFDFPKSINTVKECLSLITREDKDCTVLDYFGGSGTTAHATIELNKLDNGNRKYVLIEMGDHFEDVTKLRTQKVIYSKDWKEGKPVSREGVSHCFKYLRLESYEDALANIQLKRTEQQHSLLDKADGFRESYMLKYMLDAESKGSPTLLNVAQFDDPFNYQLLIGTGSVGETKPTKVDLVETFNWLLGLRVRHMDSIQGYRIVEGTSPKGEKVLVIWRKVRDLDETDADKIAQARAKANTELDTFFKKQQYNTLDMEYDMIYVNGDNNLMNIPAPAPGSDGLEGEGLEPHYKVRLIEEEFQRLMFDVEDV